MNLLFTLKVNVAEYKARPSYAVIRVYSVGFDYRGATSYRIGVHHAGVEVFNAVSGPLYGAFSPLWSNDGKPARYQALSHVAMHPSQGGGEGKDFYAGYSEEQLAWVGQHGEVIELTGMMRYCGDNGNPRN